MRSQLHNQLELQKAVCLNQDGIANLQEFRTAQALKLFRQALEILHRIECSLPPPPPPPLTPPSSQQPLQRHRQNKTTVPLTSKRRFLAQAQVSQRFFWSSAPLACLREEAEAEEEE